MEPEDVKSPPNPEPEPEPDKKKSDKKPSESK